MNKVKRFGHYCTLGLLLCAAALLAVSCGGSSSGSPSTTVQKVNEYDFPSDITASSDGSRLYVANNVRFTVSIVDPGTLSPLVDIPVSCAPRHLAVNDTNTQLYVSHDNTTGCRLSPLTQLDTDSSTGYAGTKLSLIDLTTNSAIKEVRMNGMNYQGKIRSVDTARGMVWDTATGVLYVAGLNSNSVTMIDTDVVDTLATQQIMFTTDAHGEVLGFLRDISMPVALDLTSDGATLLAPQTSGGKLSLIDTASKAEYAGSPWTLSGCTTPSYPLIYKATGDANANKYAFVSCNGSDSINVYDISDTAATAATLLGRISIGPDNINDKPTVLYLSPDGTTLLVLNTASNTVQTIPWSQLKQGSGQIYGLVFSLRPSENDVNTLLSDMAVIGTTVYVTDLLANRIYKFNYNDASLASRTITYNPTDFATFPY